MPRAWKIEIFRNGLIYERQRESRRNAVHSDTLLRRSKAISCRRCNILCKPSNIPGIEFSCLSTSVAENDEFLLLSNVRKALESGKLFSLSNSVRALREELAKRKLSSKVP